MTEERRGKKMNKYMAFLFNKRSLWTIKGLKNHFALKSFKRRCLKSSPSFGDLWEIADFIKYMELVFFYDNSSRKNGLYSSPKGYQEGTNGFTIRTDDVWIKIKLYSDNAGIMIETERLIGNNLKSSISLVNGNWADEYDDYDEALLNNIISIIWNYVFGLLEDYYYNRVDNFGSLIESKKS